MQEEMDSSKEKLDAMKAQFETAEMNEMTQYSELQSCLCLVCKKAKTIQSLNMALSTRRRLIANSVN